MRELGVGIIGANPHSCAFSAHVPAIAATPGLRVGAVATTREESARRAAHLVGGAEWFTNPAALAKSESVDLILISVRVPRHRELIMATMPAGKPILSEWPLGASTSEAEEITAARPFRRGTWIRRAAGPVRPGDHRGQEPHRVRHAG